MKEFFTYEQQIEKLKSKGLIINDENKAISFLRLEGYYNVINGYSPNFKANGVFYRGTTFEEICHLYAFDKNLRSVIYKHTSSIESHIKAIIAHEFSKVHGVDEKVYLQPECFSQNQNSEAAVLRLIAECQTTINEALNHNSNKYREYIAHNYQAHGHVPMWVLIRALSFGTVSIFYKNMLDEERTSIAKNYGLSSSQLANMLEVVVSYRNIVAHGERTFCARLPKTRLSTRLSITQKLCIAKNNKGEIKFGRNDFLALLISCKYLLPENEFQQLMDELIECLQKLSIHLTPSMMGRIKICMGLKSNSWLLLPKLKIEEREAIIEH
ncbi:MAG: Abi family protein [Clostridia bacterium]|nr:Abi family protein [Clostridia bacterium]